MNHQFIEARELIAKAREALRRGDKVSARQLGEKAAYLAPKMEDVWLVLAASDPNPHEALAYARKAVELNPQSTRARRGVEWASEQLKGTQALKDPNPVPSKIVPNQVEAVTSLPKRRAYQTVVAMPLLKSNGSNWLLPALLIGAGFMVVSFLAFLALASPMFSTLINSVNPPSAPRQEILWASVEIAKPGVAPIDVSSFAPAPGDSSTVPNQSPLDAPPNAVSTPTPTDVATEEPTPAATETPGMMAMEIIEDTPTSEYVPPKPPVAVSGNGARWIDVDLTNQMVYAYEGDVVVNSFIVSTGVARTPTVTGEYKIYVKVRVQDMRGPGYHLRDVPYVMFFYKDYGLHGTYWHNNFGIPMSRGCVNLTIDDAAWLFSWASVGTVVNVHY
jgi:lipoprotein-anchoring transpeptidase ErfK/SrfK